MNKPVDNLFEIRPSRFGKGLFATRSISADTVICKATGRLLTFAETLRLGEHESHCLQIDVDKYILCDPPFLYSNHSCEPNCALNANLELFSVREIRPNEELVWDYSTSMYERHWTMQCFCGSKNCRGLINDFDLLPRDIQMSYLQRNMVLPFIVCQLQEKALPDAYRA